MFGGIFTSASPRDAQISRFMLEFPQAKRDLSSQTSTSFDLQVQTVNGLVPLRVFLPPRFPDTAPVLQFMGKVNHHWVNEYNQVTGHSYLSNWNPSFQLGQLVKDVTLELGPGSNAVIPPRPSPTPAPRPAASPPAYESVTSRQPTPTQVQRNSHPSNVTQQAPKAQQQQRRESENDSSFSTPSVPSNFPELERMDKSTIDLLINDPIAFHSFFQAREDVKTFQTIREAVLNENAKIAQENAEKEMTLGRLHVKVSDARDELQRLKKEYDSKACDQLERDSKKFSPKVIIEALENSANELDDSSEDLSSRFANGEVDASEFVKQYMQLRKQYHQRMASLEWSHRWL